MKRLWELQGLCVSSFPSKGKESLHSDWTGHILCPFLASQLLGWWNAIR